MSCALASVAQSMQRRFMKHGIICSNCGIPGGDAETRDNPGKPGILGRYAAYVYTGGSFKRGSTVEPLLTDPPRSKKQITSLERTSTKAPIDFSMHLI